MPKLMHTLLYINILFLYFSIGQDSFTNGRKDLIVGQDSFINDWEDLIIGRENFTNDNKDLTNGWETLFLIFIQ